MWKSTWFVILKKGWIGDACIKKNPSSWSGMPPYKLLLREAPEATKIIQALAFAIIGCSTELDGKNVLLKTPQGEMKLVFSVGRHCAGCWERSQLFLSKREPYKLQK